MANRSIHPRHGWFKDRTGERIGLLTLRRILPERRGRKLVWECLCDCGAVAHVVTAALFSDGIRSCGCLNRRHGATSKVATEVQKKLFKKWSNMRARCRRPTVEGFHNYGGRGIFVCDRWLRFKNFFEDMSPSYEPGLTLDRIDNDGPYSPGNCRWATMKQQSRNQRKTCFMEIDGVTKSLSQWSEELGISRNSMRKKYLKQRQSK